MPKPGTLTEADAAEIAAEVIATPTAAEWLLFMAEIGPKPTVKLDLKANWLLVWKHDLVADPPKLNECGMAVARAVQRLQAA